MIKMTDFRIILASNSPRRKELLSGIDVEYEVRTLPDIDESFPASLPHEEVAEFLACKKADAYLSALKADELLITADTIVLLDGMILGKPADKDEAADMLRNLAGKRHRVITGVGMTTFGRQLRFSDTAYVTFGPLSDEEISYYVSRYNPLDKAGAYGVQEWIGYVAVEKIEGSYFNVMGLPIHKVYHALKQF
ncbi:MAG: Maf-like protein [Porphyromonadaceae bacterium]|nr:Maf-like protein [Porphyromonadaceae bacterium]